MKANFLSPISFAAALMLALAASGIARAAGPGVHGRVLGHDEKGKLLGVVAGAKIEFQNQAGARVGQTAADDKGYYKIDLAPGNYLYKIEAPGYRKEDAGRGMRLTQSQGYAVFNLALTKGKDDPNHKPPETPAKKIGKLRGRVLEKTAADLVGIPEARIALRRDGSHELAVIHSRTSALGQHQIGDYEVTLEAGTYHASVTAAGFDQFVDPQAIEIRPNLETKRDFVLKRPAPEDSKNQGIRGVVTIVDGGATPPPIKVQITPLGAGRRTPIDIQESNNIRFVRDLPEGRYRVTASAVGFPTATSPPLFVLAGRYTLVNLALRSERVPEPKTTIEVFVFSKTPVTEATTPLPGAHVTLLKADADPLAAQEGTTDATGHAIFPVAQAGEYIAEAHLKGYRAGSGKGAVELGKTHEVGIELIKESAPPAEITLTAMISDAATKRPLAGAKVLARQENQALAEAARGVTDSRGEVALKVLREGSYTIMAQLSGYEPGGVRIDVRASQVNRALVNLQPIATAPPPPTEPELGRALVTGYVAYREVGGQLRSVPGTTLVWERVAPRQPAFTQFASTGSNGRYEIELHPGRYSVRVEPPVGFERLEESVDIAKGSQEIYFLVRRLERPTPPPPTARVQVSGQVVAEASSGRFMGVANAEILFAHADDVTKVESNSGGEFGARLLPDRYRVHVRAKGFESLDTQAEVQSGMSPLRLVLKLPADQSPEPMAGALLSIVVVERQAGAARGAFVPVAGAQVQLSQQGRSLFSGVTDSAGRYAVRVKPGSYTVGAAKRGYAKASSDVTVSSSDVTRQIVLTREDGGKPEPTTKLSLTVHVARRGDRPTMTIKPIGVAIAGAQITVLRGSQAVASGTTNPSGLYTVQLPPGSYAVKASAPGLAPAGKTIALTDHDETLNFQLEQIQSGASGSSSSDAAGTTNRGSRGSLQDRLTDRSVRTRYVVEHRNNAESEWIALGTYATQRDAQYALMRAVERGQIRGAAPAESRIRTVTGIGGAEGRP